MTDPGSFDDPPEADVAPAAPPVPRSAYPPDFESNALPWAVVGLDGRIQDVNPAFVDEVGLARAELVGHRVGDLWRFSGADGRDAEAHLAAEGVFLFDAEPAPDRDDVTGSMLQFMALYDDDHERVGTTLSHYRAATRKELQQRSLDLQGYQLSFDQIEVGMVMTGIDGYVTRCNPAMQRMLGRTPEEIASTDALAMIHPDHRSHSVELGWDLLSGASDSFSQETRLLRADGSTLWVHESTTCVRDEQGNPLHFSTQFTDIEDRKRAEAERDRALAELTAALDALRESESKFKFLVQGIPVPLIEIDDDFRICSANAALAELLGRDPIGLPVFDVMVETDVESARAQYRNDELGSDSVMDVRIRRADGTERWVRSHARVHQDDRGEFRLATATWTDITESRRETDELRLRASTDPLTGLANRATLFSRLEEAIARAGGPGTVAVLFVDLDHFKPVNDRWGHKAGDELLGIVAERLEGCVRQGDVVGRIGGDEFVIVVDAQRGASSGAEQLGHRIVDVIGQPFDLSFGAVTIGASVGLAFGGPESDARDLIHRADVAVYEAKSSGRARLVIAEP